MNTATDLHLSSFEQARLLIARTPPPVKRIKRKQFERDLPDMLETALGLLLDEIDVQPGQANSGAIGCRLLAACIARLRD